MEIKQLEYVIMAAEMGSFNKASEYLYTTQSSVSKVIRSLEEELGYRQRDSFCTMLERKGLCFEKILPAQVVLSVWQQSIPMAEKSICVQAIFIQRILRKISQRHWTA